MSTGTLHAELKKLNGQNADGVVVITVNTTDQQVRDPIGNVVFSGPAAVKLIDGQMTIQLPATDDATLSPTGFSYAAVEQLTHVDRANYREVEFLLPATTTVELAGLASGAEVAGDTSYGATLNAVTSRVDDLEEFAATVPADVRVFTPKQYGATGGGVADDSDEVQACFTAAGNFAGQSTVVIDDIYRVTKNLYGFGLADFDGPGSIVLDADLSASDGNAYWINMGIKAKSGTVSAWTGTWSVDLSATANAATIGRMFNIHHGIYCWITGTTFDLTACAATSTIGPIGIYNNAGWTTNPERSHIHIVGNTILAAQAAAPGGSEGIGIGPVDHLWIEDNYIHGIGDDPIGIHTADHFTVSGNRCFSRDGRLYVSGGTNGHVHDNHFERIANPDASWTSGGALMMFDIETATQPANADLHIHDNTLVHGAGIISATYGIRLRGVRRFNVHDNRIHDTSGFGYAVTWEGITVTSWTDSEGLEGDNKARTRDGRIVHNVATGVGANGLQAELVQFAGDCVGPIVFEGNTPGAGGILLATPAAYTSGRTGQGRMPVKHKSGIYHANHAWAVSTGTPAAGTIQAQPLLLDAVKTMTKLAVEVTTGGGAGAVWRFGIYADNDGYPGALVLDAGTAASTATGLCEVTLSQLLAPGLYWLVAVPQVATSAVVCHNPIPLAPIGFGTALTMTAVPGLHAYQTTGVTGALPTPWTVTVSASGANCPRVLWKFA